jgi:hypothetical protein
MDDLQRAEIPQTERGQKDAPAKRENIRERKRQIENPALLQWFLVCAHGGKCRVPEENLGEASYSNGKR